VRAAMVAVAVWVAVAAMAVVLLSLFTCLAAQEILPIVISIPELQATEETVGQGRQVLPD
jgi:hypothetical protein